jgi:hypothetical protein
MKVVIPDPAENLGKYILGGLYYFINQPWGGERSAVLFLTYPLHPPLGWIWVLQSRDQYCRCSTVILKSSVNCIVPDIYFECSMVIRQTFQVSVPYVSITALFTDDHIPATMFLLSSSAKSYVLSSKRL